MTEKQLSQAMGHAAQLCAQRGVRLTHQRRRVLELLCSSPRPLSAYEILDRMRDSVRNPAPPTVYRALDFLREQGLVHKLESIHAFVGCTHPDRPHASQFLICTHCGEVNELESETIMQSLRSAAVATGFQPEHPVVELVGTCAQCAHRHPGESKGRRRGS